MTAWELPTSLEIGGVGFSIRSDFRAILDILISFSSPDFEDDEKIMICLQVMYEDWEKIPPEHYQEAVNKAVEFIDAGIGNDDGRRKPTTMDWEQDAPLIIPAVNRVAGREIRSMDYLHWWTFLGMYMEIGESLFSSVMNIRQKKAKGKKLEKYEQEFYRDNKSLCDLNKKYSEEEKEEQKRILALLG